MIKGTHRQMIMIKTDKNSSFEAAYFLLRTDPAQKSESHDILREANNILAESVRKEKAKQADINEKRRRALTFLLGGLVGALSMGFIWILSLIG